MLPSMRTEATSMLKLLSNLQKEGKGILDDEINKWLDRLALLDSLEKELERQKD
jgi:hypothetical protein